MLKLIKRLFREHKAEDIVCPHCGYYCLGKGGFWCIDKPMIFIEEGRAMKRIEKIEETEDDDN